MSIKMNKSIGRIVRNMVLVVLGIVLVSFLASFIVLLVLSPGKMRQLKDGSGNVIENSISEKVFVELNENKMGMFIKGKDRSNPVLLFVHGGPGMPEYFLEEDYPTNLEDYFTVVWWDQRGAGLSYNSEIDEKTMTEEQFVEDTIAVTKYLCELFGQEKIYLMAHSWGTYIGIQAVEKSPELYSAYIGMGQTTYQKESEQLAYEYMLQYYAEIGDDKTVAKMKKVTCESEVYNKMRDGLMHRAGIGTTHKMKSVVRGIFLPSLANKEYTLRQKINLWIGKKFSSQTSLAKKRNETDLRKKVTQVKVPVYFFSGKYDYTVNYKLAEDYLKQLEAPIKGFYLFDQSAHSPIFEEPDKVEEIMRKDVLKGTNKLAKDK